MVWTMQPLAPGQSIAGYEIVRLVTSGGMASLYLARRRGAAGFQKLVAIKVVHPHLAAERRFIGMFLDEARLVARIQHPNVVHVEELLEQDGMYLMVMEFVQGCSLFDLLRKLAGRGRAMNPALAAWVAARSADGLHAAHELADDHGRSLNVVHRDVSPQNILLSFAGHVKLIDFGVAKSTQQQQQTRAGVLRGKVGYMSPEQANGLGIDRRTDVYALGIVLWEMLTCRRLFHSPNEVHQLDMVRAPRVHPPGDHVPLPAALDEVVMDALRPDPSQRIPTAKAFRDRLIKALPEVATIDNDSLAGLLGTVMSEEIESAPRLDDVPLEVQARPNEAFVQQHTRAVAEASYNTEELDVDDIEDLRPLLGGGAAAGLGGVRLGTAASASGGAVSGGVSPSFIAPPPEVDEGLVLPPAPAPSVVAPPAPPSRAKAAGSLLTTLVALAIALSALGAAVYLAYAEGWFDFVSAEDETAGDAGAANATPAVARPRRTGGGR